jgi:hypothetical protein
MLKTRIAAAAAALLLAGAVLSVAGPAFADDTTTSLAPCTPATSTSTTVPLYTAKCAPAITGTAPGSITVTLPGVGSLTFTVAKDGTIDTSTQPSVSLLGQNFSHSTPKISADGTHISVTFVNIAEPEQRYTIKVKISPPTSAGGAPTIDAVAKPSGEHHDQENGDNEDKDHEDQKGAVEHDDQGDNNQGQQQGANAQGEEHDGQGANAAQGGHEGD